MENELENTCKTLRGLTMDWLDALKTRKRHKIQKRAIALVKYRQKVAADLQAGKFNPLDYEFRSHERNSAIIFKCLYLERAAKETVNIHGEYFFKF